LDRVRDLVTAALRDQDGRVRQVARGAIVTAVTRLGIEGATGVIQRLILELRDSSRTASATQTLDALVSAGPPADALLLGALIHALEDEDPEVQRVAAMVLGKTGDERALTPLMRALQTMDAAHRQVAAGALAQLGVTGLEGVTAPSTAASVLVDNGDGTITDRRTGLMWQKGDGGEPAKYGTALATCQMLDLAGYDDWRLPRKEELSQLASLGYDVLKQRFPALKDERYWAETSPEELRWAESPNKIAYTVDFDPGSANYGRAITYYRTYSYYVRAVRSTV
jgi:hypothetical protein